MTLSESYYLGTYVLYLRCTGGTESDPRILYEHGRETYLLSANRFIQS